MKKAPLRVYDKLGVSNRVELVLYALAHRENYKSQVLAFPQGATPKKLIVSVTEHDQEVAVGQQLATALN